MFIEKGQLLFRAFCALLCVFIAISAVVAMFRKGKPPTR